MKPVIPASFREGGAEGIRFPRGMKHPHIFDPTGPSQIFDEDTTCGIVVDVSAGAGIFLLPGHGGGSVVEHQNNVARGRWIRAGPSS